MQQTETYKLNKPETTDPFTPAPLNENADKLEAALSALTARTVTLENCRIVVGQYEANTETVINLGERPAAVLVSFYANHWGYNQLTVGDMVVYGSSSPALKIVDNGFWVADCFIARAGSKFSYIAFLGDYPVENFQNLKA